MKRKRTGKPRYVIGINKPGYRSRHKHAACTRPNLSQSEALDCLKFRNAIAEAAGSDNTYKIYRTN